MRNVIMRGTVLMLVYGMVLSLGLLYVQAEQRMGGTSGRSGGPTPHRALLMTPMVYTTPYYHDQLDSRDWSDQRGQGAEHQPDTDYLHPLYHGPTVGSGSGGLAVKNELTTGYPHDGISCSIPDTSASQKTYDANRPWYHTFPKGYTMQFVPFYAAEYTGFHWAVYDQTKRFYSFDDGDATSGDYDYEDSQELPAGCLLEYMDRQKSDAASPNAAVAAAASAVQAATPGVHFSRGIENAVMANYSAPAPPTHTASGNVAISSAAMLGDTSKFGRPGLATMLCKPVEAARDRWHKIAIICWTVIPASIVLIIFAVCLIGFWCNRRCRVQN